VFFLKINSILFQKLVTEKTSFEIVFDVTLDRQIKKLPNPQIIVKYKVNGAYRFCCFLEGNCVREDIPVNKYERKMILDWVKERDIHHLIRYEFDKIEIYDKKRTEIFKKYDKLRTYMNLGKIDYIKYEMIRDELDKELKKYQYN
jgi:hypothetical protein